MPKIIKLTHKDDLPLVIKQMKSTKERDIILELEKESPVHRSPEALKLIRKTAEVLGKTLKVQIGGEISEEDLVTKMSPRKVARSDIKPKFSDIRVAKRVPIAAKPSAAPVSIRNSIIPKIPKIISPFKTETTEDGTRMEIDLDRKPSSKFSKFFILSLIVLVFAVFGLAVLLPKADVTVFARSEPITRDFEITVDKSVTVADPNSLQIPGISVTKEVSQTKNFPTTGAKVTGTKTGGTVTIYNNTANTLKLNATTTTLLAANGKKYFLVKDVAGLKPNGVANPGIQIAAESGGADYNLPANTKLQIVNTALGNADVYAQNPLALGGGTTGTSTKVLSQEDLDKATDSLIAAVISQAEADLTTANGVKMRLLDSAVKKEVLAKTANKDVGAEVNNFDMTLIAKVTGLAFREDDVTKVVVSKINEVLSNDKYLLDGQQKPLDPKFKTIDLTKGSGVLDIHFETVAAYRVDADNLPKILAGKNESEIKEILLSKPEIDKVDVKFWPNWFVHKAPKFNGKIKINTVLAGS